MANEVIKKIKLSQDNLPTINSITGKYDVRYRVVSEDKNRTSHWSPIININPNYIYVAGNISIVSSGITTVAWDTVTVKIGTNIIGQAKDYDVWVKWSKAAGLGDFNYVQRISGNSITLVHPTTFYINGVDQEQSPNRVTVEVYLKGEPITRDSASLLVYSPAMHTI
jgi:hypothetical protein